MLFVSVRGLLRAIFILYLCCIGLWLNPMDVKADESPPKLPPAKSVPTGQPEKLNEPPVKQGSPDVDHIKKTTPLGPNVQKPQLSAKEKTGGQKVGNVPNLNKLKAPTPPIKTTRSAVKPGEQKAAANQQIPLTRLKQAMPHVSRPCQPEEAPDYKGSRKVVTGQAGSGEHVGGTVEIDPAATEGGQGQDEVSGEASQPMVKTMQTEEVTGEQVTEKSEIGKDQASLPVEKIKPQQPPPAAAKTRQESPESASKDPGKKTPPPEGVLGQADQGVEKAEDPVEIEAPKPNEDMPSFGEWKQKMLEEQAEHEKTKQLEAQTEQVSQGKPVQKKSSKSHVNYAAVLCGAKMLATNPEAQNPGFILSENKDQYMIQPCKAKKWFIVELCEPVQVQSLEIANLELFSSLPGSFVVHISDRYPTKEWTAIGTFHARDERSLQSYMVPDEVMFAKYMKIEMLSHYGNEHYCPLTVLRVYGLGDEEDDTDTVEVESATGGDAESETEEQPKNLFTSATDTVLSLVKTVLKPAEEEGKVQEEQLKDVVNLNATAGKNTSKTAGEQAQAGCGPNGSSSDQPPESPPSTTDSQSKDSSEKEPVIQQEPKTDDIEEPATSTETPIVIKLEDGEEAVEDSKRLVTLIETPYIPLNSLIEDCQFCEMQKLQSCMFGQSSVCGYYKNLKYVYPTCCVLKGKPKTPFDADAAASGSTDKEITEPSEPSLSDDLDTLEEDGTIFDENDTLFDIDSELPFEMESSDVAQDVDVEESILRTQPDEPSLTAPKVQPTPTRQHDVTESDADGIAVESTASQSTVEESDDQTSSTQDAETDTYTQEADMPQIIVPQIVTPKRGTSPAGPESTSLSGVSEHHATRTLDTTQIQPTSTDHTQVMPTDMPSGDLESGQIENEPEEDLDRDSTQEDGTGSSDSEAGTPSEDGIAKLPDPENQTTPGANGNGMKDIYAEAPSSIDKELNLETVAAPSTEEPVQKLSSAGKQTAFMRLKNRIKALELNLNLSSRYLEELSLRYKRQMEDMYSSFNKTIGKLGNKSKTSEERDLKQQEQIIALQNKVYNLTEVMFTLQDNVQNVHKQVIERHLYLMILEALVFAIVFSWCVSRQQMAHQYSTRIPPESFSVSTTTPIKGQGKPPETWWDQKQAVHRRRNSIDATPPRPKTVVFSEKRAVDDIGVSRRSECDEGLPIIEPSFPAPVFVNQQNNAKASYVNPKKKKVPTATLR